MADLFAYLDWRGDLPFSQVCVTPADALLFSTLVYMDFEGIVQPDAAFPVPLKTAAAAFSALPNQEKRCRTRQDPALLQAAAASRRFGNCRLCFYRSKLIAEEETQFAAMAFLLDDGSAFLAFRGTDMSLVGWKEDFNMTFQDSIPAQREALAYTMDFAAAFPRILHLGGHSKGGNLAVFSAAKASGDVQLRICDVYNLDGPGFTEYLLGDEGYIAMVPKIRTYIPESSIIGILLEHEEPYSVIKSRHIGLLQHEPYSWEVLGGDFIHLKEISSETRFINQTIKNWIADMSREDRSKFVDAVYDLLSAGGANRVEHLLHPKNIWAFFKALNTDAATRNLLGSELIEFLQAAREAATELEKAPE